MEPATFRRFALVAWVFQALIVVSGAAVRLTQAGLGCDDWPSCSEDRLAPEWELHGWIEFGNRLISLVVTLSTVAVLVAAYRRRPRRGDLVALSWGLVGGTLGQVVLGGVSVLLDLNPIAVSAHFLLSLLLLWWATKLWWRADPAGPPAPVPVADHLAGRVLRAVLPLATVVLFTGTIVTGSGPNSGDSRADRLDFTLTTVARVHSISVWIFVAALVVVAVRLATTAGAGDRPAGGGLSPSALVRLLVAVAVAQGAVGYTQFALGVPAGLVEVHVAGAVIVWILAVVLHLRVFDRPGAEEAPAPGRADDAVVA